MEVPAVADGRGVALEMAKDRARPAGWIAAMAAGRAGMPTRGGTE